MFGYIFFEIYNKLFVLEKYKFTAREIPACVTES